MFSSILDLEMQKYKCFVVGQQDKYKIERLEKMKLESR